MTPNAEQYCRKRMQAVMPYIENVSRIPFDIAVVIPAVNEFPSILRTIDSLCAAAEQAVLAEKGKTVRYIVVVNNRRSHSDEVKRNNEETATALSARYGSYCTVIDCYSEGHELPEKDGAGFSRKIGLDYAYVCARHPQSIICCMDADTTVDTDYFTAIFDSFNGRIKAGVTDFTHRLDGTPQENAIITAYECYLKEHARRLKEAHSPWYPVALGPTLVCTAETYAASGGMSRRTAGEDFYFLQALLKTCPSKTFCHIPTMVHPSPRVSSRVPFGTGAAVKGTIEGTYTIQDFSEESFAVLENWLLCAVSYCEKAALASRPFTEELLLRAESISPRLKDFLVQEQFCTIWERLCSQNRKNPLHLQTAFHCWFDGLKTLKLFHALML